MAPVRGVGRRRPDVGPDQLRRQQELGEPLDLLAFERVDAVAGPDPVRPLQDAQVDPPAAAGTRLDLEPGVRSTELVEEPVHRQRVAVHPRRAVRGVAGVDQVPVVIPLEVADAVWLGQQRGPSCSGCGRTRRGGPDRGPAGGGTRWAGPVAGGQDPLGVGAGKIRVRVDHLGFHPEPELHAQFGHPAWGTSGCQPLGPNGRVDLPSAPSPAGVVAATCKPPVVEHIPFHAESRGPRFGELDQDAPAGPCRSTPTPRCSG